MCGIFAYLSLKKDSVKKQESVFNSYMRLQRRGPETSNYRQFALPSGNLVIGFHRLAINDRSHLGDQPFIISVSGKTIYVLCNGEIYNHNQLAEKYHIECKSHSDCEILPELYHKVGIEYMLSEIQGFFAMLIVELFDDGNVKITSARDVAGARPLYISTLSNTEIAFCSELKGSPFLDEPNNTDQLPSGCYSLSALTPDTALGSISTKIVRYFNLFTIPVTIYDDETAKDAIFNTYMNVMKDLCKADRVVGFALSGGFDSSSCASSKAVLYPNTPTYTFTIGEEGSSDVQSANVVAQYHNTVHKAFIIPKDLALEFQDMTVWTCESYDITTNRASTWQLMLMLCVCIYCEVDIVIEDRYQHLIEKLRAVIGKRPEGALDLRVINIGDGADEIAGGYISFKNCKTPEEFDYESKNMFAHIYQFDGQRADRCTSNSLECNSPFLERRFVEMYYSIDPKLRMPRNGIEKYLLRSAFSGKGVLPDSICWRRKEALSDAVSPTDDSWYITSQKNAEKEVSDEEFSLMKEQMQEQVIPSKEAYLYRKIFRKYFGKYVDNVIPYYWKHIGTADGSDPSARTLEYY